jgi:hypothetical protein
MAMAMAMAAPMRHHSSGGGDSPRHRAGLEKPRVAFRRQAPMHTEANSRGDEWSGSQQASPPQFDVQLRVGENEPVHHSAVATWALRCEAAVAAAASAGMPEHLVSELRRQHFELMDTAQDALDHAHQQKLAAKAAAQEALALVREARELAQLAEKHGVSACAEQQHDVASVVVAVDESLQRLTAAMARDAAVARQRSAMDIRFNSLQLGAGLDR